ncbi:NAD(P)-dependent oxidoreductase [Ferrovibrio terrae]|uniref:NAD-dependent epimerase/dehydratase family protein n=1 Tax=Ferrovibrio terrae TaxID=2594003 RepID=UPI003137F077
MTIVVSGGTGFIGRHLVRHLVESGEDVHVLARQGSRTDGLPNAAILHRIDDPLTLGPLLLQIRPSTCYHLATRYMHDTTAAEIPALLAANLGFATQFADAATRSGCRAFVNTGTASQLNVRGAYMPASLYAASKQAFEDFLVYFDRRTGLPCATVLLYDTYGPDDTRNKLLMQLVAAARTDTEIALSPGEQEIDLLHIDDVVMGLFAAAQALHNGAAHPAHYALSSGRPLSIRALGDLIATINGRPLRAAWGSRPYRDGEIMQTWKNGTPPPAWKPRQTLEDFLRKALKA